MKQIPSRLLSIRGQLFYAAVFSLLGLLSMFENLYIYGGASILSILLLSRFKGLSDKLLVLLMTVFFIFMGAGYFQEHQYNTQFSGKEKDFLIHFDQDIKIDGNLLIAYGTAYPAKEKVAVRYRFESAEEKKHFKERLLTGYACNASGTLELPQPARNPNAFDYKKYLYHKKISWTIEIDSLAIEQCTGKYRSLKTDLLRLRQQEIEFIEKSFPSETAALSAALLFGNRELFNPETERAYQKIGVVHLLAISGLHVGLLAGMLYFSFIRLGFTKEASEMLLLIFLPFYAVLTGLAPPVVRAAAMLILLIGARRMHWKLSPLDAISIAFIFITFTDPLIVYDIGFQLSFSVSFSLVISAPKLLKVNSSLFRQTAAASLISQMASMPVILYSFYEVSLISFFANLIFVPLFSFILLPLLLITYLTFKLIGSIPTTFLLFIEEFISTVNHLSAMLAEVPGSTLITGRPGAAILILQLLLIPIFFSLFEKIIVKKVKPKAWIYLLPLLPIFLQLIIPYLNPYGKVIFIDVGQGDSILIQLPFNKGNYLIDTGGKISFVSQEWQERQELFDPGKDIVVPLLKSEGVSILDKLILTHGDADHIGGAEAIFGEIRVSQLLLPRYTERSELELEIIKTAQSEGTDIVAVGAGTAWAEGGSSFYILNPAGDTGDRNENSIVLLADIGGKRWLFTGDLGVEGEQSLLAKIDLFDIDVLKVGHHGSKYSSSEEFISRLMPETAVISVGAKNRYGHPGKEILERLGDHRVQIFRTDTDGAVIFKFKGDAGTFFTQIP
jgi:competence protein ComEC